MLTRDDLRTLCLAQRGAVEEFPFGPQAAVFKVRGKMFALVSVDEAKISLKCDPTLAIVLRQTYPAITPGYHLNKQHWNTIVSDGSVPDDEVRNQIEHAHSLIVNSLTKAERAKWERGEF
jgi:predicted DNA-binding protein (MmcQ/YjbR family)